MADRFCSECSPGRIMMVMPEDGWEERREGWRAYYQSVHLEVMHKILQTPYPGQPRKKVIPAKRRKLLTILEGKDTGQDLEEEERERNGDREREKVLELQ